jgi:ABC-type hemin transport system ATPase subunit
MELQPQAGQRKYHMKVKNSNLMAATGWLRKINSQDHSIRFAFHVSTVISRVNAAIKVSEEMRQKIVKDHPLKVETSIINVIKELGAVRTAGVRVQRIRLTP